MGFWHLLMSDILNFLCRTPASKGSKTKILRFNIVSPFLGYLHLHAFFYKHVIPMGFWHLLMSDILNFLRHTPASKGSKTKIFEGNSYHLPLTTYHSLLTFHF